jgi:KaiC/GvpD/RAD55 family RecA-like ATPase
VTPLSNVGIATGPESGIVCLDIDVGTGGEKSLDEWRREFGPMPETVQALTGSGGTHFILRHPGNVRIVSRHSKLAPGIDVKGDGGQFVACPSMHASGRHYGWIVDRSPDEIDVAPIPPWLLEKMIAPTVGSSARFGPDPTPRECVDRPDDEEYWLRKAIARAAEGNRNDTGFWLGTQLRDSGLSEGMAAQIMDHFARSVPQGASQYRMGEAMASMKSAYRRPAREPARSQSVAAQVMRSYAKPSQGRLAEPHADTPPRPPQPIDHLRAHLGDIIEGRAYNVPFPWPRLTELTQALLPGSITVVCGDPGTRKTYFVLECLKHWVHDGIVSKDGVVETVSTSVLFLEKDLKFYLRRLLAQLEGDGKFIDYSFYPDNGVVVEDAMQRHSDLINKLGSCIHTATDRLMDLDAVLLWIQTQAASGRRVIVVDPITAVAAGAERWTKDDAFVMACQSIATAHGCSIVFTTHSKKGNRQQGASGHDMAAGAAYFRFSDTTIWITNFKAPKIAKYETAFGIAEAPASIVFELHKTREGRGAHKFLVFDFGEMRHTEKGKLIEFVKE